MSSSVQDILKPGDGEYRRLDELRTNAGLNQKDLAARLQTSVPSVQRAMSRLKEGGHIVRKGGKRFGYWEIHEQS